MKHRVPADLRDRAVAAVAGGQRRAEVVRAYGISPRTLERWLHRSQRGETLADRPRAGRPPTIAAVAYPALRAQVAAHPGATLQTQCDRWAVTTGVRVSPTTMGRLLARLELPLKKTVIATERDEDARGVADGDDRDRAGATGVAGRDPHPDSVRTAAGATWRGRWAASHAAAGRPVLS